ncbi:MAG: FkbM family methyltransferase [Cyclobacteriaceae bacterium]
MVERKIPTLSIADLLEKHRVQNIDLIHIDTEGYHFEILKLFNLKVHKPKVIIYEWRHLGSFNYLKSIWYLKSHSYLLFEVGFDTVAIKSSYVKDLL